jgi:hypothetical protein
LYRSSFARCWFLALIYALSVAALTSVVAGMPQPTPGGDPGEFSQALTAWLQSLFTPAVIGGYVLFIVVSWVIFGAVFATENSLARGDQSFSVWRALGVGLWRVPTVFVAALLSGIIFMVGFILLIIPGIYFAFKLQLWMAAIFVDDAGPFQALGASWRLTRGRWWRGLAIAGVIFIVILVFTTAFSLLGTAVASFVPFGPRSMIIVTQLISAIGNVLMLPMSAAIAVAMYHDFKLRGQGGDLAARMDALGKP